MIKPLLVISAFIVTGVIIVHSKPPIIVVEDPDHTRTGIVHGKITDTSGIPIKNANITLRDKITIDDAVSTKSTGLGEYRISNILPGNYEISAEIGGRHSGLQPVHVLKHSTNLENLTIK